MCVLHCAYCRRFNRICVDLCATAKRMNTAIVYAGDNVCQQHWRQREPTTVARTAQQIIPSNRIMALTAQNNRPVSEDPKATWQDRLKTNRPVSEDHGADRAKQQSCQRQRRLRRIRKGGLRPRAVKCGIGLSLRLLFSSLLSSSCGLSCPKQLRQIYVACSEPLVQDRLCSQECGQTFLDLQL